MSEYFNKLDKLQMDTLKEKAVLENVPIIKDETLKLILFLTKFSIFSAQFMALIISLSVTSN